MRRGRILYIAYPLLPVTEASCGGAEQILSTLEREMKRRGWATVVAAAAGSRVAGELYPTGGPADGPDQLSQRDAEHNRRILQLLNADEGFDLVHDMSGTFWRKADEVDAPVLATLHLPPELYRDDMFAAIAPNIIFNCVSQAQARRFHHLPRLMGVVPNGIDLEVFGRPAPVSGCLREEPLPEQYLLWLGRICEEKGPHLAPEVAERSGIPLVLAGSVYPFSYHQRYFERELLPALARNPRARFVEHPSFAEKLQLLQHATALLVTSLVEETSCVVAMEAMACGTPVIAFRRGAIPEVVHDGVTGFLVDGANAIPQVLSRIGEIDRRTCRKHVWRHFSAERMANDYERLYEAVLRLAPRLRSGLQAA